MYQIQKDFVRNRLIGERLVASAATDCEMENVTLHHSRKLLFRVRLPSGEDRISESSDIDYKNGMNDMHAKTKEPENKLTLQNDALHYTARQNLKILKSKFLIRSFQPPPTERLYDLHFGDLNRYRISVISLTLIIFLFYKTYIIYITYRKIESLSNTSTTIAALVTILVANKYISSKELTQRHVLVSVLIGIVMTYQFIEQYICILHDYSIKANGNTSGEVAILSVFLLEAMYIMIPIRLTYALCVGVFISIVNLSTQIFLHSRKEILSFELIISHFLILCCANINGLFTMYPTEYAQRHSFLETRNCIENRFLVKLENSKQEKLLKSILPEHVAREMMETKTSSMDRNAPFYKIYIHRYDRVSILFADMCGFTALSSRCTAEELVYILNEIFEQFDNLAEKNYCLRIKILGDCYLCVSGMPDENLKHAKYCCKMGLDVIEAISYLRNSTYVNISMRVGIHTGTVYCGVLGLKKWQFDIWSENVDLANAMESGGVAGKVHISEETLKDLEGEFEVEPGNGDQRSVFIRDKNVQTYLIKCKQPTHVHEDLLRKSVYFGSGPYKKNIGRESIIRRVSTPAEPSSGNSYKHPAKTLSGELFNTIKGWKIQKLEKKYLKKMRLTFLNRRLENEYWRFMDPHFTSHLLCSNAISIALMVVNHLMYDLQYEIFFSLIVCQLIFFTLISLTVGDNNYKAYLSLGFGRCIRYSTFYNCFRLTSQSFLIFILIFISTSSMFFCQSNESLSARALNKSDCSREITLVRHFSLSDDLKTSPIYSEFMTMSVMISMTNVAVYVHSFYIFKILMLLLILMFTCISMSYNNNYFFATNLIAFCAKESHMKYSEISSFFSIVSQVKAIFDILFLMVIIIFQTRIAEETLRFDFIWNLEAREEKEAADIVRHNNRKLINNMLPVHVADYFIKQFKTKGMSGLYHEKCPNTCVMFASVCNFSQIRDKPGNESFFDSLNLLNEIISDFDTIISKDTFSIVEKIKTIGATYMLASGISAETRYDDNQHVFTMADLSFKLMTQMEEINRYSESNMKLRIGMSVGDVVAGVINAKKPVYDIWGHTVNMASRMDSTGLPDKIQVTDEVRCALKGNGYRLLCRGNIFVKGRGSMVTYFLTEPPLKSLPTNSKMHFNRSRLSKSLFRIDSEGYERSN